MAYQLNIIQGMVSLTIVPSVVIILCSILNHAKGAPPDTLGIPIVKSYLERGAPSPSAELGLKEFVEQAGPKEINQLISKLKPRQGKLDPVMMDMLTAFDRRYRDTTSNSKLAGRGLERNSGETTYIYPDDTASTRVASSTEENAIIWQNNRSRKGGRDSGNRFSSRYRSNATAPSGASGGDYPDYQDEVAYNNTRGNGTEDDVPPHMPFSHVTDPNLRNHRLYAWEIETYKNFTHIDQAEDLMADEDMITETKVVPPPNMEKNNKGDTANMPNLWPVKSNGSKSKRVRVKGLPHIVISLEDTSDQGYDQAYNYQMEDSGERRREPLRHSSTENIVYVHGSAEYPYPSTMQEVTVPRYPSRRPTTRSSKLQHQFRPSSVDANDVFVDPEQDFFTSTLRSVDAEPQYGQRDTPAEKPQDYSSETLPKRRRKKLKKINKEEIDEIAQASSNRFSTRMGSTGGGQQAEEDSQYSTLHEQGTGGGVQYSPIYSKNSLQGSVAQDRARQYGGASGAGAQGQRTKSDRIMYPPGASGPMAGGIVGDDQYSLYNQGQLQNSHLAYDSPANVPHHHDGGIGNYYSLHNENNHHAPLHPHIALGPSGGAEHYYGQNKHPLSNSPHDSITSTEYLGGHVNRLQNALSALNIFGSNTQASPNQAQDPGKKLQPNMQDQVIAPGHVDDFYHPYAASDHQVNQFYEDSYHTGWSNTWFILAGLIAFTAVFALLLPTLLSSQRHGKKDTRHDLEDEDLINSSNYHGENNGPTNHNNNPDNYHFDNTQNDVGQHSDVWTEIKGVYNDLVNMFRGDYSLLNKLKRIPEGPNIVYREDEMDALSSEEDEDEEDDERERLTLRNRKRQREQFLKMQKQQKNKLKQQNHPPPTHKPLQAQSSTPNQGQGKSHTGGDSGQTLVSKMEAHRDGHGKTINASSVNNLVVVSGPPKEPISGREREEEPPTPRSAVAGFVLPDTSTMGTIPFFNLTGYGGVSALNPNSFLSEWAQVQLINHH